MTGKFSKVWPVLNVLVDTHRALAPRTWAHVAVTMVSTIVICLPWSTAATGFLIPRELLGSGEFIEVFVDTPLDQCIARDPKGLYRRARAGEIKNFTGVDQPHEVPANAELHLMAGQSGAGELANQVVEELRRRKIV